MLKKYRQHGIDIAKKPLTRRIGIGVLVFFVLFGLFGYFVLPGIIKSQAEKLIADKLHRSVSIEKVDVSPYVMAVTLHQLKLMEPDKKTVFLSFDELTVNVSLQSLFRLAPVVEELHLKKPYLRLVRNSANHYNIDDLIALIANQPKSDEPARFSVYNIQIEDGLIEFDDRPEKTQHKISEIALGIPFISSLSSYMDTHVQPYLNAKINGTALSLKGKVLPFAESKETVLDVDVTGINLTKYIEYLPFEPRFKLDSGKLDVQVTASFRQMRDQAPALILTGVTALKSLKITELDGKPMLKLPELAITLGEVSVLSGQLNIAKIALNDPEFHVIAEPNGSFNLMRLLPPTSPAQTEQASSAQKKPQSPELTLRLQTLAIKNGMLRFEGLHATQPVQASVDKFDLDITNIAADLHKREASIAEISSNSAQFGLQYLKASERQAAAQTKNGNAKKSKVNNADESPQFAVTIAKVSITDWATKIEDRSLKKPAISLFSPISLSMKDISTKPNSKGSLDLNALVNQSGKLNVKGMLALSPTQADLQLDLKDADLLALQPFFTDQINLLVTRAKLSSNANLQISQASNGDFKGEFKGDLALGNVATVDKISAQDFVRWKSLAVSGIHARLDPFSLSVDKLALNDFFARVIVSKEGRINLQDIVRKEKGKGKSLTASTSDEGEKTPRWDASAPEKPASATDKPAAAPGDKAETDAAKAEMGAATPSAAADPKPATPMPPIKIRRLTLQGGKVRFTDNYIKPNYSANLMGLGGVVTGLSSDPNSTANVDLRGKVNSAPLTINGKVNPLKGDLFLDLKAEIKGMELAPLSAYSGKYAGYGIEKGQLSFDVSYKVEDRKLTAENRLILDQLSFGSKVDSPQATTLPVMLAVSLLRDRNGVIDIRLPISGSLDDPKFSIGGVIVRVIVNLLSKAITSPFALLGSAFGGGEELAWLEFDPGRAIITTPAEAKLTTLAKALNDRPVLKLEITGRTDPTTDKAGLARVSIDRKVRALKIKDMVAKGQAVEREKLAITPAEYPALLKRVYKDEDFKKPRNLIGLQKDMPVAEMEKLMMANAKTTNDDLLALGNQRAQAAKEWLVTKGKVPVDRIFILAAKPIAKESGKVKLNRVDFSLK